MMARALLHEILNALAVLDEREQCDVIDLRSLPMTPRDREELDALLGRGEVTASIDAAGTTEIVETQFPGVWWVRHHGSTGDVVFEAIEITHCPELLRAPREDVRDSVRALRARLEDREGLSDAPR